jgi:hypothetical protein
MWKVSDQEVAWILLLSRADTPILQGERWKVLDVRSSRTLDCPPVTRLLCKVPALTVALLSSRDMEHFRQFEEGAVK